MTSVRYRTIPWCSLTDSNSRSLLPCCSGITQPSVSADRFATCLGQDPILPGGTTSESASIPTCRTWTGRAACWRVFRATSSMPPATGEATVYQDPTSRTRLKRQRDPNVEQPTTGFSGYVRPSIHKTGFDCGPSLRNVLLPSWPSGCEIYGHLGDGPQSDPVLRIDWGTDPENATVGCSTFGSGRRLSGAMLVGSRKTSSSVAGNMARSPETRRQAARMLTESDRSDGHEQWAVAGWAGLGP